LTTTPPRPPHPVITSYLILIIAMTPVVMAYQAGVAWWHVADMTAPALTITLSVAGLFLLLRAVTRQTPKSLALCLLGTTSFFLFGYCLELLQLLTTIFPALSDTQGLGRYWVVLITAAILLPAAWLVWHLPHVSLTPVIVFSHVMFFPPFYSTLEFTWGEYATKDPAVQADRTVPMLSPSHDPLPDIYYVVPDAYASASTLLKRYDFDNSSFISELRENGFHVADDSRSNYLQTRLSLASSLNMDYLEELGISTGGESKDHRETQSLITNNTITSALRRLGYEIIGIPSTFPLSRFVGAHPVRVYGLQEFEDTDTVLFDPAHLILEMSAWRYLEHMLFGGSMQTDPNRRHYDTYATSFKMMHRLPHMSDKPKFVFFHLILPHTPLLVDESGQYQAPMGKMDYLALGGDALLERWRREHPDKDETYFREYYQRGYVNNVRYFNRQFLDFIYTLLDRSTRPFIVILQGDHGPALLDELRPLDQMDQEVIDERSHVLNAYYFPDQDYAGLAANISPVNSFRVVFNQFFGTDLPLLTNDAYYSTYETPYKLTKLPHEQDR